MRECAWCGETDLALYGDGEWGICKTCTVACSWRDDPATVPVRELEHMFQRAAQQRARNEARRPAGLPPLPAELDEHLAAVTERRARPNAQLMARHRDILIARNVCYFCSTRIDTTTFGASGPNVNICATCLAAARAYHEVP